MQVMPYGFHLMFIRNMEIQATTILGTLKTTILILDITVTIPSTLTLIRSTRKTLGTLTTLTNMFLILVLGLPQTI